MRPNNSPLFYGISTVTVQHSTMGILILGWSWWQQLNRYFRQWKLLRRRYLAIFGCSLLSLQQLRSVFLPAILAISTWFKENNYRSPIEGANPPFNIDFQTNSHFFEYLQTNNPRYPNLPTQFSSLMSTYHHGRPSRTDEGFYPVHERLINGAITEHNDAVFLVDVGGSKGHDLEQLHTRYPSAPGRLILQDQPPVLADLFSTSS